MDVVMHNAASVDGRIDAFVPNIGLYYELAATWEVDAHLVGADTLIQGEQEAATPEPAVGEESDVTAPREDSDPPILVVIDSRGRVSGWEEIAGQPYWSDVLVLCSETTPDEYLRTVENLNLSYLVTGDDRVDFRAALDALAARGIETVLVDSGGTLNGVLLQAGQIDEVSVLVHPVAVGGTSARSFIRGPDPPANPTQLELITIEQPADNTVWLRYEVAD